MDQQSAETIVDAWLSAWNDHAIDRILSHYAERIEFTSPFVASLTGSQNGKICGIEALQAYFEQGLAAFPHLHFRVLYVLPGIDSLTVVYYSVKDLLAAEVMRLDADGKIVQVSAHYTPMAKE